MGKPVSRNMMKFVGSVFFDVFSVGKLEYLNKVVGLFEAEVTDGLNLSIRKWEWS